MLTAQQQEEVCHLVELSAQQGANTLMAYLLQSPRLTSEVKVQVMKAFGDFCEEAGI